MSKQCIVCSPYPIPATVFLAAIVIKQGQNETVLCGLSDSDISTVVKGLCWVTRLETVADICDYGLREKGSHWFESIGKWQINWKCPLTSMPQLCGYMYNTYVVLSDTREKLFDWPRERERKGACNVWSSLVVWSFWEAVRPLVLTARCLIVTIAHSEGHLFPQVSLFQQPWRMCLP